MPSTKGIRTRTTLMELAHAAGFPLDYLLGFYPPVTTLAFEITFRTTAFPFSPDDDVAIAINGAFVYDLRRNASDAKQPVILRSTAAAPLRVGDWVEVFTFDERGRIGHYPWKAVISYGEGGLSSIIAGGSSDNWPLTAEPVPTPTNRAQYFPNGRFLIPPPGNWPRPSFLPAVHDAPYLSTRVLGTPTPNPLRPADS